MQNVATRFFNLAVNFGFTKGRRTQYVAAACLYAAVRQNNGTQMLIDFSDLLEVSETTAGSRHRNETESFLPCRLMYSFSVPPSSSSRRLSRSLAASSIQLSTSLDSLRSSTLATKLRKSLSTQLDSFTEWAKIGCKSDDDLQESVELVYSSQLE